jgi:hypothetical protein
VKTRHPGAIGQRLLVPRFVGNADLTLQKRSTSQALQNPEPKFSLQGLNGFCRLQIVRGRGRGPGSLGPLPQDEPRPLRKNLQSIIIGLGERVRKTEAG